MRVNMSKNGFVKMLSRESYKQGLMTASPFIV